MEKPELKREVAIHVVSTSGKFICFYGTADAIEDFRDFGRIVPEANYHCLYVDARYDFDEILEYIKGYK